MTKTPNDAVDERWGRALHEVDLRLVVLGTSISWGQGLWPRDKACVVFARRLEEALAAAGTPKKVAVASYAQSGAILWPAPAGKLDQHKLASFTSLSELSPPKSAYRNYEALDGETPTTNPYVWDQAAAAANELEDSNTKADLVWIDAGANDIGFLDAVVRMSKLESSMYIYRCALNMRESFEALLRAIAKHPRFQGAPILITGYYRAITDAFDTKALEAHPAFEGFLRWVAESSITSKLVDRLKHNMEGFVNILHGEWANLAARLQQSGVDVRFVSPDFKDTHAMFSLDAALWPKALFPYDDLLGHRRVNPAKTSVLADLEDAVYDVVASWAHPNRAGAALYAERVLATAQGAKLVGLAPKPTTG